MYRPIGYYLLIEPIEMTQKTKGGLLLSTSDKKEIGVEKAKVIDAGEGCAVIKKGNVIIYEGRAASKVDVDGEILKVLPENQVILVEEI